MEPDPTTEEEVEELMVVANPSENLRFSTIDLPKLRETQYKNR